MWQDFVFSIGSILFAAFLIPMAIDAYKGYPINKWTAGLTGLLLAVYSFTFSTLGLWYSAYTQVICAGMWILILGISIWKKKY